MKLLESHTSPSQPGSILREKFMNPLGVTAYRLSKEIGVTPITVSHILRGKRAISVCIAARLGTYFDVPPAFWLSLQAAHDLAVKSQDENFKVTRCEKLGDRKFQITENSNGTTEFQVELLDKKVAPKTNRGSIKRRRTENPDSTTTPS